MTSGRHPPKLEDVARPSSPLEQSLWLLTERDAKAATSWTIPLAARLRGQVDLDALREATQAVVDAHAPLRSLFLPSIDGRDVLSHPIGFKVAFQERDLTEVHPRRRSSAFREELRNACRQRFDLSSHPGVRFFFVREEPSTHRLLLVAHHLVFDGPSKAVFARELAHHYSKLGGYAAPVTANLGVSYADYAREQREALPSLVEELKAQLPQLGADGVGEQLLPWDRSRRAVPSGEGGWIPFSIDQRLRARLATVAATQDASMFQLLVAALSALLYRYDNRKLVMVTAAMGTRQESTADLIGLFANNVPLCTDVSDDPSFSCLLERVSQRAKTISRFRQVPLDRWVELLEPPRHPGLNPLFQVGLGYQRDTFCPSGIGKLGVEWQMLLPNWGAKCDVLLQLLDRGSAVEGRLEYSRDLFDPDTAQRMVAHLHTLLHGIAAAPHARLSGLPILDGHEKRQVMVEWNATAVVQSTAGRVDELFAARADSTPTATAVVSDAGILTYGDLAGRVDDLARRLRRTGVHSGVRVGIFLERSAEAIVALLGTLRAGGAFVPLDPTYPPERLSFMLRDASPRVVVTQPGLAAVLPSGGHQVVFVAPQTGGPEAHEDDDVLLARGEPGEVAYVIYTSGSTGRPKGVMVEHACLANFLTSMCAQLQLGADDSILALTPLSFDIALLELLAPLVCGGRVVMSPSRSALDGQLLAATIEDFEPTVVQATPTTWRLLVDSGWRAGRGLKALCGGEALPWELASRIVDTGVSLWNLYGPTETTVWSSIYRVGEGGATPPIEGVVAIGKPIANTEMYLLDPSLNVVAIGVPGELYIGGAGVARGYLGDPALTAACFIPHPLSTEAGSRLYRTGDRARQRRDGTFEFLGRNDDQMKLRGFRIEPLEIETALLDHPQVADAAVSAVGEDLEKALVAHVVVAPPGGGSPNELRRFLRRSLPSYMVPSTFVFVDALPRTPNNKVDRALLASPTLQLRQLEAPFIGPRNEAEARMSELWADVLRIERVGVHDDFFDLGGNSMQLVQLISTVRDAFGMELALRDVFAAASVAEMCELLPSQPRDDRTSIPRRLGREGPRRQAPLSFAQEAAFDLGRHKNSNLTSYGRLPLVSPQLVERTLRYLVQRHDSLRLRFGGDGEGGLYQERSASVDFSLSVVDVSDVEGRPQQGREEVLADQQKTAFDLACPPLFKATLLCNGSDSSELAVTFSHMICDATSVDLFWEDLYEVMATLAAGGCPQLEVPACHYLDFAAWQRQHVTNETLDEQVRYWKDHLRGAVSTPGLPRDSSAGQGPSSKQCSVDSVPLAIEGELYRRFRRFCKERRATPFVLTLTVFQAVLCRRSDETDFVMVALVNGRVRPELQRVFGCFAGPKRIRVNLCGDPTFEEAMQRASETVLAMLQHVDVPMTRVWRALLSERAATGTDHDLGLVPAAFELRDAPRRRVRPNTEGNHADQLPYQLLRPPAASGLLLRMWQDAMSMYGEVRYARDHYERTTIEGVAADVLRVLTRVLDEPELRLSQLPVCGVSVGDRSAIKHDNRS